MQTEYQSVMDISTVVPAMLAVAIHAAIAALEVVLAVYLLISGGYLLLSSLWGSAAKLRRNAVLRTVLGAMLLLPTVTRAPWLVSLVACIGILALLTVGEGQPSASTRAGGLRRWARRLALAATSLLTMFLLWEQDDAARLGRDLVGSVDQWDRDEIAWQNSNDLRSPKVGDLAPDFELQDVDGNATIRLSTFRGKRPVALVFGSYT